MGYLYKSLNLIRRQLIKLPLIGLGLAVVLATTVSPTPQGSKHLHKVLADSRLAVAKTKIEPPAPAPATEAQQAETPAATPVVAPVVPVAGMCGDWLTQAGIPASASVLSLIQGESGCNPYSANRSSGACGIAQELPCGKSGCALGDPVCQLRWMNGYVANRYGSWDSAYATWLSRYPHWY